MHGRETLPLLTKESVVCEVSSTGRKYLRICHEIISKNAKASLKEYMRTSTTKINALSKHGIYTLIKSRILNIYSLHPPIWRAKRQIHVIGLSPRSKIGKNRLNTFMSNLSGKLELSKRYTNHCVRVTLVTILKEHGYSNWDVRQTCIKDVCITNVSKKVRIISISEPASSSSSDVSKMRKNFQFQFNGTFTKCAFHFNTKETDE